MTHLPAEIWAQVCQHIWEQRFFFNVTGYDSDLLHLALTCRTIYNTVTPYVYRHCPSLGYEHQMKGLISTITSNNFVATSVRILTIEPLLHSRAPMIEDEDSMSTVTLLSAALERLPNLTSLRLFARSMWFRYAMPEAFQDELKSLERVAQRIFSFPTRFPFHLKSFATDLTCGSSVLAFLLTQPIDAFQWRTPRIVGLDMTTTFKKSPQSLALTECTDYDKTLALLPALFALFPSVEHLSIEFTSSSLTPEKEYSPVGMEATFGRLKSLQLLGRYDWGTSYILKSYAPLLISLERLDILVEDMNVTYSECLDDVFELVSMLPSLKMLVFGDSYHYSVEWDLNHWISPERQTPFRDGLMFYVNIMDTTRATGYKIVEVYRDADDGLLKHREAPFISFPVVSGSAIRLDRTYRGNHEIALNVLDCL